MAHCPDIGTLVFGWSLVFWTSEIQSFLLVLVSNMSIIKTLGIGLKLFQISSLVLVLVLTEILSREVLVLVLNKFQFYD